MITRRTFSSRAALFVLGCALQVNCIPQVLKRKIVDRLEHVEAGMIFNPTWNGRGYVELWRAVEAYGKTDTAWPGRHILCAPVNTPTPALEESHPMLRYAETDQNNERIRRDCTARLWMLSERDLREGNFHFPV